MKYTFFKIYLFLFVFTFNTLGAQIMGLEEISFQKQIENATMVVEGEVIAKKCFWNNNLIYTANTVKVQKIFKGEFVKTIDVITKGGVVGLEAVSVSSGLKLQKGTVGLFMLENIGAQNIYNNKSADKQFKPYSAIQGFYKYNLFDDLAANPFKVKQGIASSLYQEIESITKINYLDVSGFSKENYYKVNSQNKTAGVVISGFSPSSASAGTKTQLTINGSGFGTSIGVVEFPNADDGGSTYINALDTEILSWNDSEIVVEIPSMAATGKIKVLDGVSIDDLVITYAESNVIFDSDDRTSNDPPGVNGPEPSIAYRVQHYGQSILTDGYQWRMETDFFNDNEHAGAKASFERAFENWRCATKINWTINSTSDNTDESARDFKNIIRFDIGSELEAGVLATCISYYSGCGIGSNLDWYVSELDIVFDDARNWNFGPEATTGNQIDFETVALHELGHGHQLGHVNDTNDLMHYSLNPNNDLRDLGSRNITGATDVQSRSTSNQVCGLNLMTNYSGTCSLSLGETLLMEAIRLYPNPSTGQIFITNDYNLNIKSLSIFELSGRKIADFELLGSSNTKELNLENLSKGIYLINIQADNGFVIKKLVLE